MHRKTCSIFAFIVLSSPLPAQETWQFDHASEELTIAADGSLQIGPDSLNLALGANGTVSVVGEGIELSAGAGKDILLERSTSPTEALLTIITKRPTSLAIGELAGSWIYQEIEIEEGANGPSLHGFTTSTIEIGVDAVGGLTIGGAPAGTSTIDARKHALLTVEGEALDFAINASKDLMISTTSEAGFHYFRLMARPESGGTTSQLAGPWTLGALAVDSEPTAAEFRLEVADFSVAANGSFTFPGESTPITLAADGSGGVTAHDDGDTFALVWGQSRNFLTRAATIDTEHELLMFLRRPSSLALADLAGTWDLHDLAIENSNLCETIAENYYPDGTVQERYEYIESDEGERLRDGLATTYFQGTETPASETTWSADAMAGTSVKFGLARYFDFDGTTVIRTENYLDDQLDGASAVQGWNPDGQLVLLEDWSGGDITQRVERQFSGPGDPDPVNVVTSAFIGGTIATQLIQSYHPGTTNLQSLGSVTYTGGVATRNETIQYQIDGTTKTADSLTVSTPSGVIIEQSSSNFLGNGVGLRSTTFASFNPDETPITHIEAHYHPDGATIQSETTTTYPGGTTRALTETFYDTGVKSSEWVTIDGVLIEETFYHPNGNPREHRGYAYLDGVTVIGTERFYDNGIRAYEGTTVGGELDGTVIHRHPNGNHAQRTVYSLGRRNGLDEEFDTGGRPTSVAHYALDVLLAYTSTSYHPTGPKAAESRVSYPGGVRTQVDQSWHENGTLASETGFVDWQPDGAQRSYDEQGIPIRLETYVLGVLHGSYKIWHADSNQVSQQGTYLDGEQNGLWITYYPSGQVETRQPYSDDLLDGESSSFSADGNQDSKQTWLRDELREDENWSYHPDGTLRFHSIRTRSSGDLQNDLAESEVREEWDEQGRMTRYEEYSYGRLEGETRSYQEGIMTSRAQYQRGLLEGLKENFFFDFSDPLNPANGNLLSAQEYIAGSVEGPTLIYNPENQWLLERAYYRRGKLHGLREQFYDDDRSATAESPRYIGEYIDGLRNGLHTTWVAPDVIDKEQTYLQDILNGPWRWFSADGIVKEEGQYTAGLKSGWWTKRDFAGAPSVRSHYREGFIDGISETYYGLAGNNLVNQRQRYRGGVIHGITEKYGVNPHHLRETTLFQDGQHVGPIRTFWVGGALASITPIGLSGPEGTRLEYYSDGSDAAQYEYVAGVLHGPFTTYHSYDGRVSGSGTYHNGKLWGPWWGWESADDDPAIDFWWKRSGQYSDGRACGTWTSSYYFHDTLTNTSSVDTGIPCSALPPPEFEVNRGLVGTVTADGVPLPSARVSLGGPFAITALDGSYLISLPRSITDTAFTLKVTHPQHPDKELAVTIPYQTGFVTKNVDLAATNAPVVTLGDPSVGGLFFLQDVPLSVEFRDAMIEWGDADVGIVKWRQGSYGGVFSNSITPGIDLNPESVAAKVIARNGYDQESDHVDLPDFEIYPQPTWTPSRGAWVAEAHPHDGSPATYRYKTAWPEEPLNIGINQESLGLVGWTAWQLLPVIGDELGLFDVQFDFDAKAHTDGTGDLKFGGAGEVKAGGKAVRLEADGEGDLRWGETLEVARASVALDALIKLEEEAGLVRFFPALENYEETQPFGWAIKKLNSFAKIEFGLYGGIGARLPIDTDTGTLRFRPSELRLTARASSAAQIGMWPLTLNGKLTGNLLGTWMAEDGSSTLITVTYTTSGEAKVVWRDQVLSASYNESLTYPDDFKNKPAKPTPSKSSGFQLVQPDFLAHGDYAQFRPPAKARRKNAPGNDLDSPIPPAQTLLGNAYPYANPAVAEHNGTRAMVYVHFDPARPVGQSTRLYFTLDTGNGFSLPAPIHVESRADFSPQLAFLPDGRLITVFETSRLGQIALTAADRVSGLETAWSLYDPGTGTWTAPTLLSDNAHLDHAPRLAPSAQGPMVVWQSNAANGLVPTSASPAQVHFATWNGAGFSAPALLPPTIQPKGESDLAFDGSNAIFTWINDEDGEAATHSDTELYWSDFDGSNWSVPTRATTDAVTDQDPRVFCLANGNFELFWTKGVDLVRMADFSTRSHALVRNSSPNAPSPAYDVACDAQGRTALLWSTFEEGQVDLRYAVLDPTAGTWSNELFLTNDEGSEKSPAFALSGDGNLIAAFLREEAATTQHDLLWLERRLGLDLTVGPITVEPSGAPDQFTIAAEFRNLGDLSASSVSVDFHLGDPEAGGSLLGSSAINLSGGFICNQSISTTALPPGADGTIFVRIDPGNALAESDESNNTGTTALNPVDLVAEDLSWSLSADRSLLTLTGVVSNDGRTTQSGIPVSIDGEQGPLLTATIPSLPPGASIEVAGTLATAVAFPMDDNVFTVKVDPNDTLGDANRANNEQAVSLTLRYPYSALADSDGDGALDAWELANFGTLDRDGTGDFDGDSVRDLFEHLTLTDPTDGNSFFEFTIEPDPATPYGVLISFPSVPGVNYLIQRSTDLESWTDYTLHAGTGTPVLVAVAGFANPGVSGAHASFFRIQVSQN